jgi:WXG100 family type VII secretion target
MEEHMSGNTTVDRAEMQKAAGQIDNASGKIHKIQQDLSGEVTNLMGRWKGNAAEAFLRSYTEFDGQFGKVQQELEGIHQKLVDTQMTYTQNEQEQEAQSQAINALLQG